ncbi:MAG: hypothetical protein J7K46_12610 [Bacteroidales bacterium]|nr:hypothetical protein [Bacteroidales bacterium]
MKHFFVSGMRFDRHLSAVFFTFLLFFPFFVFSSFAQSPGEMSYQAILRDGNNKFIPNT